MKNTFKLIIILYLCASSSVSAECRWPLKSAKGSVPSPSSELNDFLEEMIGEKYYDEKALVDLEKPEGCFQLRHTYKVPLTKTCVSKKGNSLSVGTILDEKYHVDTVKQAIEKKFPNESFHYESSEKNLLFALNTGFKIDKHYTKFLFIQIYNAYGQETDEFISKFNDDDKSTMIRYEFRNSTKAVADYELCLATEGKIMNKKLTL